MLKLFRNVTCQQFLDPIIVRNNQTTSYVLLHLVQQGKANRITFFSPPCNWSPTSCYRPFSGITLFGAIAISDKHTHPRVQSTKKMDRKKGTNGTKINRITFLGQTLLFFPVPCVTNEQRYRKSPGDNYFSILCVC